MPVALRAMFGWAVEVIVWQLLHSTLSGLMSGVMRILMRREIQVPKLEFRIKPERPNAVDGQRIGVHLRPSAVAAGLQLQAKAKGRRKEAAPPFGLTEPNQRVVSTTFWTLRPHGAAKW